MVLDIRWLKDSKTVKVNYPFYGFREILDSSDCDYVLLEWYNDKCDRQHVILFPEHIADKLPHSLRQIGRIGINEKGYLFEYPNFQTYIPYVWIAPLSCSKSQIDDVLRAIRNKCDDLFSNDSMRIAVYKDDE